MTIKEYEVQLLMAFSEIITSDNISNRVRQLRLSALNQLYARLKSYDEHMYLERLVCAIAEKKCAMILKATTKKDMEKIVGIPKSHYNGGRYTPDEFSVPEEELICLSQTSLYSSLSPEAMRRYEELFKMFFPKEYEKVWQPQRVQTTTPIEK